MKNSVKDVLWVAAQLGLLAALLLLPAGPRWRLLAPLRPLGLPLGVTGLTLAGMAALKLGPSLTPWPSPRAQGALQTRGVYRYVRHPIYSGGLLWAGGVVLRTGGLHTLLIFGLLGLVFRAKAGYEERLLTDKFPGYPEYARHTPRFFPVPRRP